MRFKVRGGTVEHGQRSLCESCRWSTIIRGAKPDEEIVECGRLSYTNPRIVFPVISCTDYLDRNRANLREMEEIAWVLRSDTLRKQLGFVRSSKLKDDERYVLDEN